MTRFHKQTNIPTDISTEQFQALLQDYFPRVYNYLYRFVRRTETAEDLTQESFLKAWQARNTYNPKQSWPTWLYRIARNTMIDSFRKKREVLDNAIEKREIVTAQNPESELAAKEKQAQMEKALAKLPELYATVLYLHYLEEMKIKDIAFVLKRSVRATTSLLHRARVQLKAELSALPAEIFL